MTDGFVKFGYRQIFTAVQTFPNQQILQISTQNISHQNCQQHQLWRACKQILLLVRCWCWFLEHIAMPCILANSNTKKHNHLAGNGQLTSWLCIYRLQKSGNWMAITAYCCIIAYIVNNNLCLWTIIAYIVNNNWGFSCHTQSCHVWLRSYCIGQLTDAICIIFVTLQLLNI